jgi:UPF0716 family protein affecting phage T7 exclusion
MIYFFLYLFLEVMISVNISSAIGGLMTFFEIIFTALIGIAILINFRKTLVENMTAVSYNCIDLEQFQRLNLFTLFGAILLILPGFLSDMVGALMQFSVFTSMLVNSYNVKFGSCNNANYENHSLKKDSDVIDVEIISDNSTTK